MAYLFENALVRKINKNIVNALSNRNIRPSFELISNEHNQYVNTLKKLGLNIYTLESLDDFPDSIFVEDPGLTYNNNYISLRPADKTRSGESAILANEVSNFFDNIYYVKDGYIEGGDILRINNHFIIGLSCRTNKTGAENLLKILRSLGASVEIALTPKNILHFKSECSLIEEDTILLTQNMIDNNIFKKKYNFIKVPRGEEIAANSIRINNNLLIPSGCPETEKILSKKYNLISLKVDELFKIDAGLSCMSLRW